MRTQQRLIRCASIALLAAALHGAAQAEGGLPGSPQAVGAAAAAPASAPDAAAASPGGAALNPFAEKADVVRPAIQVPRERHGARRPDLLLTAAAALAGLAALGWLTRLALR